MTSGKLTRRGAHANAPARLPGLQAARVADPGVRQALESLREWVEVRLGSRGDAFERAVTERDLTQRLSELRAEMDRLRASDTAAAAATSTKTKTADLSALENTVRQLESALETHRAALDRRDQQLASDLAVLARRTSLTQEEIFGRPHHWLGAQTVELVELQIDDAGSVRVDGVASNTFSLLIDQDCTIEGIDDAIDGAEYRLVLTQDAAGGHDVGFGPEWMPAPVVDTSPGAVTVVRAVASYDSEAAAWRLLTTGTSGSSSGGVLPMVTGAVPPVLVYLDDGSLVYAPSE